LEFRTIDGSGNHPDQPDLNAAGSPFARLGPPRFADGVSATVEGPNPRAISNLVVGEGEAAVPNGQGLSGMMYAWGQFIDHDLTRTASDGVTRMDVVVPAGDPHFAEGSVIAMTRAVTAPGSGTGPGNPATAVDQVTGWLDASMIYGSDPATAAALRLPDGRMRTSDGGNLPILAGAFLAGDVRAGENPALTALHTLFLREHNAQVERLALTDPTLDGDALYERARAIVAAEVAHITYAEFLPHLLGRDALPAYAGHDPGADPRLLLEFVGAAYRWGHSTVSAETERKGETGEVEGEGFELRDVFFMPAEEFAEGSGADGFLRHLATDRAQAMDARIVEDLRSFLFDPPVAMDLAAANIQRGRDLGLPTLNQTRAALGLDPYTAFGQITPDAGTVAGLRAAFGGVDTIDLWTGGLSEGLAPGAFVGPTFAAIMARQFTALRDGDRLWYANQGFDDATLAEIERTTLADVILRNTDTAFLQPDVFVFFERRGADTEAEHPDAPQLVVGTGEDQDVVGGALGDLLAGGDGRQVLRGLEGADVFAFGRTGDSPADTPDEIRDFAPGEDRIDLSAIDTDPATPGDPGFLWRGDEAFAARGRAEARYEVDGAGGAVLLLDRDGDGAADMAIRLLGVAALGEADLVL
jgi:hypothetical protein